MKAYLFPGQGAQYVGMGQELFESNRESKILFLQANDQLGFEITKIMFEGTDEELKRTDVTQPAIFLHSVILAKSLGNSLEPDMVAGHSLGEFSALVVNKCLSFESALSLVIKRADAMQKACEAEPSTMAAILGMEDEQVNEICKSIDEIVVPANYNCPGQLVISGSVKGVELACTKLTDAGAKRAILLKVGGAFHSPLMEPARQELETAIEGTDFSEPTCAVYQNVDALPTSEPEKIKSNLIAQLTSPVLWSQIVQNMVKDGASEFIEVGPGNVLQGLVRKINAEAQTASA